jgi:hypothetical protein
MFKNAQREYDAMMPSEEGFSEREVEDKQFEMMTTRLREDPRAWLSEAISEADSCDIGQLTVLLTNDWPKAVCPSLIKQCSSSIGMLIMEMVEKYCLPPKDEAIAALRNDQDVLPRNPWYPTD